ncbi:uncharacterized protein LOC132187923 [Corylus avellana]|uniref:uncharacterized protein LOC132187923 n=1 Tax=Corylus avellana TaxID=13451 RepID=UPI00286C1C76|nr:uncharacterized protein LOC132187923 [Corylus avellana]
MLDALTKKVDALAMSKSINDDNAFNVDSCSICASPLHLTQNCSSLLALAEYPMEQVNAFNDYQKQSNGPYSETYNPGWRNHPNLSRKQSQLNQGGAPHHAHNQYPPKFHAHQQNQGHSTHLAQPPAFQSTTQVPASSSQSALEGTLKTFIQTNGQMIQELKNSTMVNSQAIQEVKNAIMEQVQSIVTLRSGRQVDNKVIQEEEDNVVPQGQKSRNNEGRDVGPPKVIPIVDDSPRSFVPKAPYPERLKAPKKSAQFAKILEQVPSYAKFLKDLITVKRRTNVLKKVCLTEQVNSIFQCKLPIKYKDLGCPTISSMIGDNRVEKALLDLGDSVYLLPYLVYLQVGLRKLKPTSMKLQLADRSVKIPRGIVEDVLIKIDKFYFPIDFIVLDTEPEQNVGIQISMILGRPLLATANALINCRTGVMKITFRNMIVELNIFDINKQPIKDDEIRSVCLIEETKDEIASESNLEDPMGECFTHFGDDLDLERLCELDGAVYEPNIEDPKVEYFAQSGGDLDLDRLLEQVGIFSEPSIEDPVVECFAQPGDNLDLKLRL